MASMRDIKRRKSSIQSTQQITKAMKLVSTVKLQRAKTNAEKSKAYFHCMYETVSSMLERSGNIDHRYLKKGTSDRKAVIMITSNRGLAGGYDSNVIKLITKGDLDKKQLDLYTLGKKGRDALSRFGCKIVFENDEMIEDPSFAEAMKLSQEVLRSFENGATEAFRITVTHENPAVAQRIANTIATVAPAEIIRVVKAGSVEVIDFAELPQSPSSPNIMRNTAMGAMVAFMLSVVGVMLIAMFDTVVKSEEQIGRAHV